MSASVPRPEIPLYTIRCYNDVLYRVIKRLFSASRSGVVRSEEFKEYDTKLPNALSRARSAIREYALCNPWEFFFTFTIDPSKCNRYDLVFFLKELLQWFQNLRKSKCPRLKYLLVPEPHKDGAWHFHGLVSGINTAPLPPNAPRDLLEGGYLDWPDYRLRYGWCSLAPVRDPIAVGFYVSKYITKSACALVEEKGVRTHYHSQNLNRALPVGYVYHGDRFLDGLCQSSNAFYSFGYFRSGDVGAVVNLCDEVGEMYQSYVFEDPVTHEIAGIAGGDDDDASFQLAIQAFWGFGSVPLPWDMPAQQPGRRGGSAGR